MNWKNYHDNASNRRLPPSATLAKALELFHLEKSNPGFAIDLGCGTGIDTLALLEKGWRVMAVDNDKTGLLRLNETVPSSLKGALTIEEKSFNDTVLPESTLVNASFSLPFCEPIVFRALWEEIENSIVPSGRFAGHFFGPNDSWSSNVHMTFHQKEEVRSLFQQFSIEYFEETEKDGQTLAGTQKHWHVYHIVGRKKM